MGPSCHTRPHDVGPTFATRLAEYGTILRDTSLPADKMREMRQPSYIPYVRAVKDAGCQGGEAQPP